MNNTQPYNLTEYKTCENPIFDNIDATYILTLESSKRIHDINKLLFTMTKVTYLQINKGFRSVYKENVNNTSRDIIHAVKNICLHARQFNNILILEDDAELMPGTSYYDLKQVDNFLGKNHVNIYSFGSLGFVFPYYSTIHMKFLGFLGFGQSLVYSNSIREKLLKVDISNIKHLDAHFISKQKYKFTYYRPLIVQKLISSPNQDEWSISVGSKRYVEKISVKLFIFFVKDCLRMDKSLLGWFVLYFLNQTPLISFLFLLRNLKNILKLFYTCTSLKINLQE